MATTVASSINHTGGSIVRVLRVALWDLSRALIVTRREVRDMFRDWRIIAPTFVLTLIFPTIANWGAGRMLRFVETYGAEIVGERLIPFLLMVVGFFPISFSLIIALESFVGEKERHSLEPLLATPLTNLQLYLGKTLSSTLPPILGSLLGVTVYLVGIYANVSWKPPIQLLIQIILLNLVQALVMVAAAVVVSSQTTSVRAANLLASFIIIPMSFLIQAEALIMFWARYGVLWLFIAALTLIYALLVRMGVKTFNREELLGNDIDQLNVIGGFKKWWRVAQAKRTQGSRRSVCRWYREEVLSMISGLWPAILVITIALSAAFVAGTKYADIYRIPSELLNTENWVERFEVALQSVGFSGPTGLVLIVWQNVRVLALASLGAVFSFGVLAIMLLMVPLALAGYLSAHLIAAGVDPVVAWMTLLPHSIIEIPAAILAGAAAVRLGATLISPPPGKTVGEAWIEALAEATRLWFVLILPLLGLAAVIEIYVTPLLVRWAAGGG